MEKEPQPWEPARPPRCSLPGDALLPLALAPCSQSGYKCLIFKGEGNSQGDDLSGGRQGFPITRKFLIKMERALPEELLKFEE